MKWSIEQKIIIGGLGLALLILSGVSAFSYWSLTAVHPTSSMLVVPITNGVSILLLAGVYYRLWSMFTHSFAGQEVGWEHEAEYHPLVNNTHEELQREPLHPQQLDAESIKILRSLQESEKCFRVALKNAPIVVFNQDLELRYTWVYNPASGMDGASLVGKLDSELFEPENAQQLIPIKRRVLTTGKGERQEICITVDGNLRYYDLTVEPLCNHAQEVVGITCAATNITDIRIREQKLRAIFEGALDGILIADDHGYYIEANPSACQLLGLPHSQLVSRRITEFIAPDCEFEQVWHTFVEQGQFRGEIRLYRPDGTVRQVEYTAKANFIPGQHLAVLRDITERQQAEQELKSREALWGNILNTLPVGVWITNAQGVIVQSNPAGQQIWAGARYVGVNQYGEYKGWWVKTGKRIKAQEWALARAIANGETSINEVIKIECFDGTHKTILNSAMPLWNENQDIIGAIVVNQDITELKQLEAELAASEERFRTSIENMLDCFSIGTSIRDESGEIVDFLIEYVNRAACTDTGMTQEEQIGKRLCELLPAYRETGLFQEYCQVVETGQPLVKEFSGYKDTYQDRSLNRAYHISVVKLGDGYVATWRDITQRKQAEAEQCKTQELYRTLTRNFPNGIVALFDKELRYTLVEGKGLADLGLSNEVLAGKTIEEALPGDVGAIIEPHYRAVLEGKARVFEVSLQDKIYLVHLLPLQNEQGEVYGGISMSQNISDRKRAELALLEERNFVSAILNTANALITVLDYQGKVVHFNRACEQLTGYSFEQVKGEYIWDLFLISEEIDALKASIKEVRASQFPNEHENYWVAQDGSQRLISWYNTLLLDTDGSIKYIIGIGIDITERQQAEEIRRQLEREQELTQLRLRFFSLASHEFRTPLSTILASAQLLQLGVCEESPQKRLRNLQRIESAAQRMRQMLENILTINRAETGKLDFHPTSLHLEEFCQHLLEEIQLNTDYQHSLRFISQGDCQKVCIDAELLRSILTNLILNALKYSPQCGEIQIKLTCTLTEVIFEITDQGIGIPLADQPHLFEAFHRGENIGSIPGSGLGLTVAKNCVDVHGGSILVTSKVGVGTTFTVTIPTLNG